ncbi:MAG: NAD(P)-dependent glycerol-3-phosphate dehydrogenase [Candidatus Obscuribacterales bacterium]|nr:NAD(P)-dependent glycerol-3-phosphate dehydrogenase [Candidatus Obscuribacterales bacterium]
MAGSISQSGQIAKIAVLGSGSWGATLSRILALGGRDVSMWCRNADKAGALKATRRVETPLLIELPSTVVVTSDLAECIQDRDVILLCCTSQSMRTVASQVAAALRKENSSSRGAATVGGARPALVSAVKGLELGTLMRMSQILHEVLPELPVCCLSGPNLAKEILDGRPTASVVACTDSEVAKSVQASLNLSVLRLYSNKDIVGVELGGALKNVIAIAAGAVDGLNLGTNARAALITRGLAEMSRLAIALGAQPGTLSGLAGMGDLVATCSSPLSRNYRLGYQIARGEAPAEAEAGLGAVAEGVSTAYAVVLLARQLNVEMPIATQVEQTLKGECRPDTAIMNLMSRPLSSE